MIKLCDDIPLIEQIIGTTIANAISPGYAFTREGTVGTGWLRQGVVFSNKVGIPFGLPNGKILGVWAGTEDINSYDVEIYEHSGDSIGLTLIKSLSVVSTRVKIFTPVDIGVTTVTSGKQIAVKIKSGPAKNPSVFVYLGGTQ